MAKEIPFVDIELKQTHIDAGKRGANQACPLALAFRERFAVEYDYAHRPIGFKNGPVPSEFGHYTNFGTMAFSPNMIWPESALQTVRDFDKGAVIQPATFRVLLWQNGQPRPSHEASV